MTDTGEIPQSNALTAASPDSLGELLSRDPEGYQQQDLDRIIDELRQQRVRWQAAEATGTRSSRASAKAMPAVSTASAEDLGL